jgi:hypothetical protein
MRSESIQRRAQNSNDPSTKARDPSGAEARASVQRVALRGMSFDQAVQHLAPGAQHEDAGAVHSAAARGTSGGGGRLPHQDAIQRAFGSHDVGGVSAHVGGKATEACDAMGAQAYASGNSVAFAKNPDLHTAAHEAAHIVQQRAGVSLKGGVGQAGDPYERHADAVADAVVQGKSAEGLLSQMAGGGGAQGVQREAVQQRAVQREDAGEMRKRMANTAVGKIEAAKHILVFFDLKNELHKLEGANANKAADACVSRIQAFFESSRQYASACEIGKTLIKAVKPADLAKAAGVLALKEAYRAWKDVRPEDKGKGPKVVYGIYRSYLETDLAIIS